MNGKLKRRLNAHTQTLIVGWLKSLLTDEEAAQVNSSNYKELLPDETHFYLNRRRRLSAFSERWTRKQLKRLMRKYPDKPLESFTMDDAKEIVHG